MSLDTDPSVSEPAQPWEGAVAKKGEPMFPLKNTPQISQSLFYIPLSSSEAVGEIRV